MTVGALVLAGVLAALGGAAPGRPASAPVDPLADADELFQAAREDRDPVARDERVERAITILRDALDAAPDADDASAGLYRARLQHRLARAVGSDRQKARFHRLLRLHADTADRRAILAGTQRSLAILRELEESLTAWLEAIRRDRDPRDVMLVQPEVEALLRQVRYSFAWVAFERAAALPAGHAGPPRRQLLLRALGQLEFFRDAQDREFRHWAAWLKAACQRELAAAEPNHEARQARLQQAGVGFGELIRLGPERTGPEIHLRSWFQLVRCRIESGAFESASRTIREFAARAREHAGKPDVTAVELQTALLRSYLHETWAESPGLAPIEAGEHAWRAQAILADFWVSRDDPAVRESFLIDVVARRYADRDKPAAGLHPIVLLALAKRAAGSDEPDAAEREGAFLRALLARPRGEAEPYMPSALWEQARLLREQGDLPRAARVFGRVADSWPDHPLAAGAARNAVIAWQRELRAREASQRAVPREMREKYIAALVRLLDRPAWAEQNAPGWALDLGEQWEKLARTCPSPEREMLLGKAIDAYQSIPAGERLQLEGTFSALRARLELVGESGNQTEKRRLAEDLLAYASEVRRFLDAVPDPTGIRRWGKQGGWAELTAAKLLDEIPGARQEARALLTALPERWPEASALLPYVRGYRIHRALEEQRTAEAIELLSDFGADTEQGVTLVRALLIQIRMRLDAAEVGLPGELDPPTLRRAYARFATELFERSKDRPIKQRYAVTQMYADSLICTAEARPETERETATQEFARALELLRACRAADEQRRAAEAETIRTEAENQIAEVRGAVGHPEALLERARAHLRGVTEAGLTPADLPLTWRVARELGNEAPRVETNVLAAAVREVRDERLRRIPADAGNVLGLARAHRGLGEYDRAGDLYRAALAGLERTPERELYWRTELEYARFVLEAYGANAEAREALRVRIEQLAEEDARMGGLAGQFQTLRQRAAGGS